MVNGFSTITIKWQLYKKELFMELFWRDNDKTMLADALDIPLSNLSEILHRKRGVSRDRARELEKASQKVLGFIIPWTEWISNQTTTHPAFYGKPKKRVRK